MPSHKTHMSIAIEANKYLNFDNDLIMLGSVLPDLSIDHKHRVSHCRNNQNGIKGLANPKIFLDKYKENMDNPIIMGYLIHLLTDEFFNRYIYERYYLYDSNNNTIGIKINKVPRYMDKDTIKDMKHYDFKLYDKYLLYKKKVLKFKNKECYKAVKDLDIAKFDKKALKKYIIDANKQINVFNKINPLKIHKFKILNIDELNKQYSECCDYVIKFINNI